MAFADLRSAILDSDLCAGCGGCAAACPPGLLELDRDGRPYLADPSRGESACGSCRLCLDVCPGRDTDVARSERRLFGRSRSVAERWTGVMRAIHTVACPDPAIAARAAAGAAGTALLVASLRAGLADAVVVIGRDRERPWVPRAIVTDDEREIVASAQSTYCITPTLQLLRDPGPRRLGMVGVPCEIQSLQRMRNLPDPPAVAGRVTFTLEIACSSSTRLAGTEHLLTERLHLDLDQVADVRYREGAYPGEFVARTRDGRRHELPFHQMVQEFRAFKTHRCLGCPDWWSGLADVSICDGDPNIFASSLAGGGGARRSVVVVRTEMGERLLAVAAERGLLCVAPATFDPEVNLGLQRKRHRYRAMRERHPDRVPAPPVPGADDSPHLSDDEVLRRLATPNARLADPAVSRFAVVTGGAGHLGAAVAARLARDGLRIALVDRDGERVAAAAAALAATGATCRGYRADVAQPEEVGAAVAGVRADLGEPLVLVTCAGLSPKRNGGPPDPEQIPAAEWCQVLDANLTGAFHAVQAVLPAMRASGYGRIVHVSSAAGRVPSPTAGVHYAAAKAGVLGLTKTLAAQLAPDGILVVAVAPGKMRNPGWPEDESLVRRYVERVPLGRLAEAEEVAELIAFLCSERNTYVTGATVDIDGGRSPA